MRYGLAGLVAMAVASPVAVLGAGPAAAQGDPAAGKTAFNKCAACHAVTPGANKIGPTMHGVVGRKAAAVEGFTYSEAMKAYDVSWTPAELDKYLLAPRETVKGTKMIFTGLKNDAERANVIAYLETLK